MSDVLSLPDTALAKEAGTILRASASPSVMEHSLRAYLLGRAWARRRALDFDDEGFYLAALFHDLGLCPDHRSPTLPFQVASSRALRVFLAERGVPDSRTTPLVDAIDFHMQLLPRWSKGNVAGLLQVGAWMDITGLRRLGVWSEARAIAQAHPRHGIDWRFPLALLGSVRGPRCALGLVFPGLFR